ncbi:MAG: Rieske (2Fe-2S) protein, partial [Parahaliea sp.]
ARCPHRDHPLEAASVEAGVIECPLHHYRFALADGRRLQAGEEACRALRTFELVYEGNEVGVLLAEGGGANA